jgi:hypothetical protein
MKPRRLGATILIAAIAPMLSVCANPNMGYAIDIRRFESDEQRLEIRNVSPLPVEILQGRNGRSKLLAPNATMIVLFKVNSLESHLKVADEQYYFRTAGPVTNHLEETDGMNIIQEINASPVLYFRDGYGTGEVSFDLNDCVEMPPATTWETMQWGPATHMAQVPPLIEGVAERLCPARPTPAP